MDLSQNLVLKENYTFFVADAGGQVAGGEHGLYNRDTRFLDRYRWSFGDGVQALVMHAPRPDTLTAHYAHIEGPSQVLGFERRLELTAAGLTDTLRLTNTDLGTRRAELSLEVGGDFADMFEARGWETVKREPVVLEGDGDGFSLRYRAADGVEMGVRLSCSHPPVVEDGILRFVFELKPGQGLELTVTVRLETPLEADAELPSYTDWQRSFDTGLVDTGAFDSSSLSGRHREVLDRAVLDLRALLLRTEHGLYPAAGIPWYVAVFGRDALLTAYMTLPHQPDVARGVLRYLAAHQGQKDDPVTSEQPGKILHEVRHGELSRTGRVPFRGYYGTVDATPLFVMLLHRTWQTTGDLELLRELQPQWEAALTWLTGAADPDGDGFLEFIGAPAGQGLTVQTWKDSADSLSHHDGRLASGAIAGSEVQGYAYAAYLAAADFYKALGEGDADAWRTRAESLKTAFHKAFWLPELQTYAMALDGDKCPLEVHNSNAGQLLWTGIVPKDVAPKLVETLFSETNWSGWGVRTLGAGEVRYNPVSYHNGSVWPHDTALTAGGLSRYGFKTEAERIRNALYDLAATQPDNRLPELVAGYERSDAPPVPYPVACRPQAWDAAALLYLLTL